MMSQTRLYAACTCTPIVAEVMLQDATDDALRGVPDAARLLPGYVAHYLARVSAGAS